MSVTKLAERLLGNAMKDTTPTKRIGRPRFVTKGCTVTEGKLLCKFRVNQQPMATKETNRKRGALMRYT